MRVTSFGGIAQRELSAQTRRGQNGSPFVSECIHLYGKSNIDGRTRSVRVNMGGKAFS